MASGKNKKKIDNAAESTPQLLPSEKKTPKSLKPGPKIVKKSLNQNSARVKEVKTKQEVQSRSEDVRARVERDKQEGNINERDGKGNLSSPHGNKAKEIVNEKGDKKKSANAAESTTQLLPSEKKTLKSLKSGPKIVKKTLNQNSARVKEVKTKQEIQSRSEDVKAREKSGKQESKISERDGKGNLSSPHGNKKKEIVPEKREETGRRDQMAEKTLGGLIFMCNAKTKPDCFRYHVFGVPSNRQELVMRIKPGLKLFLFDFDLKLLYGIYEASSAGGMKLETAAFGGAFPVQVRFKVHKDCSPLPENVFKKAIKDNYEEKTNKFKTELTVEQVKKLTQLFQHSSWFHSSAQSSVQEALLASNICPAPVPIIQGEEAHQVQLFRDHYNSSDVAGNPMPSGHERKQFSEQPISASNVASPPPLFLTEKEYRSYGLRGERHNLTAAAAPIASASDPYRTYREKEPLMRNPASVNGDATLLQKEAIHPDTVFLSEKEYRTYGLKGRRELPISVTPTIRNNPALDVYPKNLYNPYDYSTTSLVDQYLPLPRTVAAPSQSFSLTGRETYINDTDYMESETRNNPGRVVPDGGGRLYSTYASSALSDYNQKYHRLGGEPEVKSEPVSSRYSFAGPSYR